jgi:hypothetical protein
MLHKNLVDVLTQGGLTRDGDSFVVPSNLSVTAYLDVGREALIVDRVARLQLFSELAVVTTHRKERYAVELDAVRAIRFHPDGAGPGYA